MHPTPGELFAERLREHRLAAGMSQAELAQRLAALLDIPMVATTITKIESGARRVRLDEAVYAARALGVPLTALVSEKDAHEVRLEELRRKLDLQETRAREAEWERGQAMVAIADLTEQIERLEASRPD